MLRPPAAGGLAQAPSFEAMSTRSIKAAPARSCSIPYSGSARSTLQPITPQ
jgi:hypothetical protein